MRQHGEGSISRRADGRYQARLRYVDGAGVKRRAYAYAKSEKEARLALRAMIRRIEDDDIVSESAATVASWTEHWITVSLASSDRRAATKMTYESLLRTHLVPALGGMKLRALSVAHVESWIQDLAARRSASTTRQAHAVLCMVLDGAQKQGLVRRNVAKIVTRPRAPRLEATFYSSEEVALLRSAAAGQRLCQFLTIVAFTGLRKGEALALRWDDVDLASESPVVRVTGTLTRVDGSLLRSEPKTSAGRRTIPLVPAAADALRSLRVEQKRDRLAAGEAWSSTPYVFTTEVGTPVDPRNALRWFYSLRNVVRGQLMRDDEMCEHSDPLVASGRRCPTCGRGRADYLAGSLHTLRHSAASVLLSAGVPMPIVKEILGHSSIAITVDMYGHMAPTAIADAMLTGMRGYGGGS